MQAGNLRVCHVPPMTQPTAANRRSFDWAMTDTALYNEAFSGRARALPRCKYCLAKTHRLSDCHFGLLEEQPAATFPHMLTPPLNTQAPADRSAAGVVKLCGLFNQPSGNQCSFRWCRYAHICTKCRKGPHGQHQSQLVHHQQQLNLLPSTLS